jgi:hypothetical protein
MRNYYCTTKQFIYLFFILRSIIGYIFLYVGSKYLIIDLSKSCYNCTKIVQKNITHSYKFPSRGLNFEGLVKKTNENFPL